MPVFPVDSLKAQAVISIIEIAYGSCDFAQEDGKDVQEGGRAAQDAGRDVLDVGRDVLDVGKDVQDGSKEVADDRVVPSSLRELFIAQCPTT